MQYAVAVVPALMAAAQAFPNLPRQGNATAAPDVYVTTTVTALTTFCPSSTEIVQGGKTYTATASQTLTITDCPCTVVMPKTSAGPAATPAVPAPYHNGTNPAPTAAPGAGAGPPGSGSGSPGSGSGAGAPGAGAPGSGSNAPNTQAGGVPANTNPSAPQHTIVTAGGAKAGVAIAGVVGAAIALVA